MIRKRELLLVGVISVLGLGVMYGPVFARGGGGHRGGGDKDLWLLARAAGLSKSQIHTAFKNDSNLKTNHSNLRSAHDALTNCLVSGGSCTSQISAYVNAEQALTQEKMTVWGNLFQGAPNSKQAATVLGQLQQLREQRKQIFHQVFGSTGHGGDPMSDSSDSES